MFLNHATLKLTSIQNKVITYNLENNYTYITTISVPTKENMFD